MVHAVQVDNKLTQIASLKTDCGVTLVVQPKKIVKFEAHDDEACPGCAAEVLSGYTKLHVFGVREPAT